MFYKPAYCCSCGEEIERIDWNLLTSRRFCEFCETEHKPEEWLRNLAAAGLVLFGLFGIGSYFSGPEKTLEIKGPKKPGLTTGSLSRNPRAHTQPDGRKEVISNSVDDETGAGQNELLQKLPGSPKRESAGEPDASAKINKPQKLTATAVYFCGAATKKGKPCSRRVKSGGRCWQHAGKSAMLPKEKLLVRE